MLALSNKIRQRTARAVLALVGGLWLVAAAAPCVAAMPTCPMGMSNDCLNTTGLDRSTNPDCTTLNAVDCQTSNEERLVVTLPAFDFTTVPVRLYSLPALPVLSPAHVPDRYATVILHPPLNLQNAVLLI